MRTNQQVVDFMEKCTDPMVNLRRRYEVAALCEIAMWLEDESR